MIFSFLTIGVIIFMLFRVISLVRRKLSLTSPFKRTLFYLLPVVELLCWIALLVWLFKDFYTSENNIALISISVLLLLFIIPSINLIKDFIIGLVLKIQNNIVENNYIEFDDIKGTILKAGHFRLEIIDKQGNTSSVAYHTISSKVLKTQSNNQNLKKIQLLFTFKETQKVNEIVSELKVQLLNNAWVAISQNPIIEDIKIKDSKLEVTAIVFSMHESYAEKIKEMVDSYFELKAKALE